MLAGMTAPVLYVIVCACPPAREVDQLVWLAKERGWDTCVLTTPLARRFVDVEELAVLTGHPVRSEYKHPDEPDVLPPAEAVILAPATVNTINKWAAGICDTLALGILVEGIGLGLPIVAVPSSNRAHTSHPAFVENVGRLRSWGVTVIWETDGYPVLDPITGSNMASIPWQAALDAIVVNTESK
jgi:phosphopantothenoylcysteine decarboxylase